MKKTTTILTVFILICYVFYSCKPEHGSSGLDLEQEDFSLQVDQKGKVTFYKKSNGEIEKISKEDSLSYLIRLKYFESDGFDVPKNVTWTTTDSYDQLTIEFSKNRAILNIEEKEGYFTAELADLTNTDKVELVLWGPYSVTLDQKIGKSLGVAYTDDFAIGLMGLNLKSSGGFEISHRERFGNAAQKGATGARLQGFTRNRSVPRLDDNPFQELTLAVPVSDGDSSLIGSKFAFYATPSKNLSRLVETIEKGEGLPHLTHKGEWMKNTFYATSSKFIMSFNSKNIDSCLDVAEKAGINCVYHPGIFETWGTYPVREKDFPEGYKSVKTCNEKAKARNMTLGAHTLSNFITTKDKLVSPIPHKKLQLAGLTTLKKSLSLEETTVYLNDSKVMVAYAKDSIYPSEKNYNINKNRELFAFRIDDEIIEFDSVYKNNNALVFKNCKRGAFGTDAKAHKTNTQVGRLASHAYKVFFPDIELQDQVAKNLSTFFNETGLERISFDGIEGGMATGHNRYGSDRFIKTFFDHLENKNIIANSSDAMHYSWHYLSNESWGEPWWAKNFRESQLDHRIRVQKSLEEDLLPRKLGQFRINKITSLKDIQWVMGLCSGYDAGIDFYVSPEAVASNPEGEAILNEIKVWEAVRREGSLSKEQKVKLRDIYTLYALNTKNTNPELVFVESWAPEAGRLQKENDRNTLPIHIFKTEANNVVSFDYEHINQQKEPGQPTLVEWKFYNVGKTQPLQFAIRCPKTSKNPVRGLYLKIGTNTLEIPFTLNPGNYVVMDEKGKLTHYSSKNKVIESIQAKSLRIANANNTILFDYNGKTGQVGPNILVNFKIKK